MLRCQRAADLLQGEVRLLGHQLQDHCAVLGQARAVIAPHRAGLGVTFRPQPLRPANRRADADLKRPAADRAEAPVPTAAATRSRKSPEYGAGISPPNDMLRHHCRRSDPGCTFFLFESTRSETALGAPEADAVSGAGQAGVRISASRAATPSPCGRTKSGLMSMLVKP